MSSDRPAVLVSGLSKSYLVGRDASAATTLAEKLANAITREGRPVREQIWALTNVSFELGRGEVLGVIGSNGAGKSTLLKLLCGITEPTDGEAEVWGRVSSLLEVGTGFHPELTGRENVYLNGCILGMRKREIDQRFESIVAFSGVERFLDTPVKRYSSGMSVRLAFAVAAHLDSEILIVDEVLAVGDAEFQVRCLGKMKELVGQRDRAVLFVSHNLHAVRVLCDRAIVLRGGRMVACGPVEQSIEEYLGAFQSGGGEGRSRFQRPPGTSPWMTEARLKADGAISGSVPMGARLILEVDFCSDLPLANPRLGFVVTAAAGAEVLNANNRYQPTAEPLKRPVPSGVITCELGQVPLMPGHYTISLWLGDGPFDTHAMEHALAFQIVEGDVWGLGHTPPRRPSLFWWPTRFVVRPTAVVDEYRAR